MCDHAVFDPGSPCVPDILEMSDELKLIVTTSRLAKTTTRALARRKATEWGFPYVERSDRSIELTLKDVGGKDAGSHPAGDAGAAFVFRNDGLLLSTARTQLRFDLGTAVLRLHSMARGDRDLLIRAGEISPGDRVFDATLGLGRDALVAAQAVGPGGEVIGVESNLALFTLVSEGLASYDSGAESAAIQPVLGDSRKILSCTTDASFDVVVIDPMFSLPGKSDGNFEALREFADPTRLNPEWIRQARRVAKRWVVAKASYEEPWFSSEGLQRIPGMGKSRWWRASGGE
jgi:16S rRNA (guanine1516-N2)-methyltransferase